MKGKKVITNFLNPFIGISTFSNKKKKKNSKSVMKYFLKKIEKKWGQKKQIHCDEAKNKIKNTWDEFCRLEEF